MILEVSWAQTFINQGLWVSQRHLLCQKRKLFSAFPQIFHCIKGELQSHYPLAQAFHCVVPRFPIAGGVNPFGGHADVRCGCFLAKVYAKMNVLDPVWVGGGGSWAGSATAPSDQLRGEHTGHGLPYLYFPVVAPIWNVHFPSVAKWNFDLL